MGLYLWKERSIAGNLKNAKGNRAVKRSGISAYALRQLTRHLTESTTAKTPAGFAGRLPALAVVERYRERLQKKGGPV